jgi:hypothetical protein
MDKPLPLKIQEFQQNISHIIQDSGIPIYILKYQIKDLLSEIEKIEQDFTQREISEYYKSQKQTEEETPTET